MIVISCSKRETESSVAWEKAGALPSLNTKEALGVAGPVSGFSGGRLLIAGGANFPDRLPWEGGEKKYYDDVFVFDPVEHAFVVDTISLKLPTPVAYAGSVSDGERIFYAGGENEAGVRAEVYSLRWTADGLLSDSLPLLPKGVTNGSLHLYKNALYFAGGETADRTSDEIWRLPLEKPGAAWEKLPRMPHPASHAVQLILHSEGQDFLYIMGGRSKNETGISTLYQTVSALNLETLEWQQKASLPYPLAAGSGVAISGVATRGVATPGHTALLFGGDKGNIFTQVETLIAKASVLEGEARDSVIRQKNHLQTTHPGFSRDVLLYSADTDEWQNRGEIPLPVPVTTAALHHDGKIYITSGEIRPGIRTPVILGGTIHPKPLSRP